MQGVSLLSGWLLSFRLSLTLCLQASARVRLLSRSRYLQINTAELGDRAHYTCVATNVAGETARQFNLTVNGTPTS